MKQPIESVIPPHETARPDQPASDLPEHAGETDLLADETLSRISISNWKPIGRGALKAVFDAELPSGMILVECSLFHKDGRHWVTVPQKQFQVGGVVKYRPAISFANRTTAVEFQYAVLKAIRELDVGGHE